MDGLRVEQWSFGTYEFHIYSKSLVSKRCYHVKLEENFHLLHFKHKEDVELFNRIVKEVQIKTAYTLEEARTFILIAVENISNI